MSVSGRKSKWVRVRDRCQAVDPQFIEDYNEQLGTCIFTLLGGTQGSLYQQLGTKFEKIKKLIEYCGSSEEHKENIESLFIDAYDELLSSRDSDSDTEDETDHEKIINYLKPLVKVLQSQKPLLIDIDDDSDNEDDFEAEETVIQDGKIEVNLLAMLLKDRLFEEQKREKVTLEEFNKALDDIMSVWRNDKNISCYQEALLNLYKINIINEENFYKRLGLYAGLSHEHSQFIYQYKLLIAQSQYDKRRPAKSGTITFKSLREIVSPMYDRSQSDTMVSLRKRLNYNIMFMSGSDQKKALQVFKLNKHAPTIYKDDKKNVYYIYYPSTDSLNKINDRRWLAELEEQDFPSQSYRPIRANTSDLPVIQAALDQVLCVSKEDIENGIKTETRLKNKSRRLMLFRHNPLTEQNGTRTDEAIKNLSVLFDKSKSLLDRPSPPRESITVRELHRIVREYRTTSWFAAGYNSNVIRELRKLAAYPVVLLTAPAGSDAKNIVQEARKNNKFERLPIICKQGGEFYLFTGQGMALSKYQLPKAPMNLRFPDEKDKYGVCVTRSSLDLPKKLVNFINDHCIDKCLDAKVTINNVQAAISKDSWWHGDRRTRLFGYTSHAQMNQLPEPYDGSSTDDVIVSVRRKFQGF